MNSLAEKVASNFMKKADESEWRQALQTALRDPSEDSVANLRRLTARYKKHSDLLQALEKSDPRDSALQDLAWRVALHLNTVPDISYGSWKAFGKDWTPKITVEWEEKNYLGMEINSNTKEETLDSFFAQKRGGEVQWDFPDGVLYVPESVLLDAYDDYGYDEEDEQDEGQVMEADGTILGIFVSSKGKKTSLAPLGGRERKILFRWWKEARE